MNGHLQVCEECKITIFIESVVATHMTCISIWVNYNNSPTWIKAIWEWFPLLTMIPVRENSEVVIKFTQINI